MVQNRLHDIVSPSTSKAFARKNRSKVSWIEHVREVPKNAELKGRLFDLLGACYIYHLSEWQGMQTNLEKHDTTGRALALSDHEKYLDTHQAKLPLQWPGNSYHISGPSTRNGIASL